MVLIEGEFTVNEDIRVLAMGHPPSEKRDISRFVNPVNPHSLQGAVWPC